MLSSRLFPSYRRYRLFFRRLVKLSEVIGGGGGGSSRQSYSTTVQFGCGGRTGGSSSWGSSSSSSNSSNHHHYHHHHHHHRRVLKMGALWSATTASGLLLYSALASGGNSEDEHYRQLLASRSPMLKKAGMLAWEENRITDEELEELLKEFILIETIKEKAATATTAAASPSPSTSPSSSSSTSTSTSTPAEEDNESYCKPEQMETASSSSSTTTTTSSSTEENGSFMAVSCLRARATATSDQDWEEVIKQPNFYVWRKAVNNSSLYEYKVFGSFFDISAYAFYAVQRDLEFRKQWDKLVLKLDIIEVEPSSSSSTTAKSLDFQEYSHNHQCPKTAISSNQAQSAAVVDDTGNELVHWVMKYPYPMKSREYLFLRRSRVDYARSTIATVSRSVPYPEIPETEEHVRVYDYISQMVIRPHSLSTSSDSSSSSSSLENSGDFHALGFDYLLTYFDDTRAAFPSAAYNWMASRGVPDFVEKLHQAALHLTESGSLPPPPPPQNRTSTAQLSSSSAFNRDGFSLLYLKSNSSSTSSSSSSSPQPPPPRQS